MASIYLLFVTTINLYHKEAVSSGMNIGTCAGIIFMLPFAKGDVDTKLSLTLCVSGGTLVYTPLGKLFIIITNT